MRVQHNIFALLGALCLSAAAQPSTSVPVFKTQTIDDKIQIGYGLAIADVQGDGKADILLADKKQIVWYENPTWTKHVITENLTEKDHVCIAARDIDGDGKCEIAVGAEWNPSDTVNSGAVFYLIAPEDRTQKWEAVRLHHEPTTHRMKWVKRDDLNYDLVVLPLHGRGNKNGEGAGVKVLAYSMPKSGNPRDAWSTELINADMHLTHNLDVLRPETNTQSESVLFAGKEGVTSAMLDSSGKWSSQRIVDHTAQNPPLQGAGEIRARNAKAKNRGFATIEPMHGNQVVFYNAKQQEDAYERVMLDDTLVDGHALAFVDVLGSGEPQIIAGWRSMSSRLSKVGIRLYARDGNDWRSYTIDDNTMACEDLAVADLNGDGKPDIIASGRRSQNVIIYWNESGK